MAINFTTSFTDLAAVFKAFANINGFCGTQNISTAATWGSSGPTIEQQSLMVSTILARVEGSGLTKLIPYAGWQDTIAGLDTTVSSQKNVLQQLAQQILITRVNNDNPQQNSTDFTQAIAEWIRQMQAATSSVKLATVTASTGAGAGNTGTSTALATLYDSNGLLLEYSFAETFTLKCTQDQFSGTEAGSEVFSLTSKATAINQLSYLWPGGSGLTTTLTMIDPAQGNSGGGNLVTGSTTLTTVGAFKAFTGSVPDAWTIQTDSINISDGTTDAYAGEDHCLKIAGNTAGTNLNTALYQSFANGGITSGSTQTLTPNTVYQFCAHVKADLVPAAGVLQFQLVDGVRGRT